MTERDVLLASFAYGSNMNNLDLSRVLDSVDILRREVAFLPGWRLIWNYYSSGRGGGAANICRDVKSTLPGVLLHLTPEGLRKLDKKEGQHTEVAYKREVSRVQLLDGSQTQAWVYVARGDPHAFHPPTQRYLALLIEAAQNYKLPEEHIQLLRSTQTCD